MIYRADIMELKSDIGQKIGQKIKIKGSEGKHKNFEKSAIIKNAYPCLFEVKYEENERSVTYTYQDVLTKQIEVDVYNGTEFSPLIP